MSLARRQVPLDPTTGESGVRRALMIAALLVPVAALALGWWLIARQRDLPEEVVIATGSEGGTYLPLGTAIADLVAEEVPGVSATAVPTFGSTENVGWVARGEAHFAFVQHDAPGDRSLRTVARLYDEVLQIVVRTDRGIHSLSDLEGRRISLGAKHSGTSKLAVGVLRHFGLAKRQVRDLQLPTDRAVSAFQNGSLDAVAVVAGLRTEAVGVLLAVRGARLLSLGRPELAGSSLQGLAFDLPGVSPAVIPAQTYGRQPSEPVGTISVEALLVTHRAQSDLLVQLVTQTIFENRFRLSEIHSAAAQMAEIQDAKGLRFPLHPGAAAFYARNEPPFFVIYAEALSFAVTLAITLGSALLALRQWISRRKKNRIDTYYLELEEVSERTARATSADLQDLRQHLVGLRRQAFRDLVAERLRADESFSIFQDALSHRLAELAAREAADRGDPTVAG